eukprot:6329266-Karenia_brevis.AAC.1
MPTLLNNINVVKPLSNKQFMVEQLLIPISVECVLRVFTVEQLFSPISIECAFGLFTSAIGV